MPLAKMSYFLIGITLYLAWRDGPNGQTALLLIFCYIASLSGATNVVEHAVVVLILIAMMCFATLSSPKILSLRVLVFFGTISYATYLVHNNIGRVILLEAYEQGLSPLMAIGGATMVSLSIATVLTYGVERPAIRFLRRLNRPGYSGDSFV